MSVQMKGRRYYYYSVVWSFEFMLAEKHFLFYWWPLLELNAFVNSCLPFYIFQSDRCIFLLTFIFLRWLPPVLHFPEQLKLTKGFLAHYDGLVTVFVSWCYKNYCIPTPKLCFHCNYTGTQIHPVYHLIAFYTNCSRWTYIFIASKLFDIKIHFLTKFWNISVKRFRWHLKITIY